MRSEATASPQQSVLKTQQLSNIDFTPTRKAPGRFSDKDVGGGEHTEVVH